MKWKVIITEQSGKDLTDYQVRVEVTDPDFFKICTDQKFVEFYDENGTTLLNHYTEEFDPENNKAVFWVKVPSIPANSMKTIYLNVNTERTEDLSNGEATFDFFDDFEDGDVSDWVSNEYGEWIAQTDFVKQGNYSARGKQTATGGGQNWFAHRVLGFSLKGYALELWIATDNAQDVYKYIFSYKDDVNTKITIALRLGYIAYKDESKWHNVVAINSNEWYKLKIVLKESGYDIYVNDDLKVSNARYYNSQGYDDYICFGGTPHYRSGDIFVDVIKVRKYTEPEPSVTVVKGGATPTLDLKKMIANCLAGKKAKILDNYPIIRLKSGDTVIKDIQAIAKHVKVDEANSRYIVMFLFIDDSPDTYTTDNQELWFPHPDGNYLAFTQTQTFEKTADEPLPLRWEIYLPYSVDELDGQII